MIFCFSGVYTTDDGREFTVEELATLATTLLTELRSVNDRQETAEQQLAFLVEAQEGVMAKDSAIKVLLARLEEEQQARQQRQQEEDEFIQLKEKLKQLNERFEAISAPDEQPETSDEPSRSEQLARVIARLQATQQMLSAAEFEEEAIQLGEVISGLRDKSKE